MKVFSGARITGLFTLFLFLIIVESSIHTTKRITNKNYSNNNNQSHVKTANQTEISKISANVIIVANSELTNLVIPNNKENQTLQINTEPNFEQVQIVKSISPLGKAFLDYENSKTTYFV